MLKVLIHKERETLSEELLDDQYKNSLNLDIRISIHELFSTNKKDWHIWLIEQYNIPKNSRILELGCGNGVFWDKNAHLVPENWDITLSDFSPGMLKDAEKNIGNSPNIQYKQINIMDIPFEDKCFDIVIANHMLYHVPDIDRALKEVRRVLKPSGKFYASTIGESHLIEINQLLQDFDKELHYPRENAKRFGLENGKKRLLQYFSNVHLKVFEGGLEVTEVQPLIQYILSASTSIKDILIDEKRNEFVKFLEMKMLQNQGKINITKATGLFEGSNL